MRLPASFGLLCAVLSAAGQTPICVIQGSGDTSPFNGQSVTTTGIVTGVFSGSGTIQGFFIEDPSCDANPATSNGLFVYNPNTTGVAPGQRVSVSGTVIEFQGLTEITQVTGITVVGSGSVTPTEVNLPIAALADWERFEGMLIRFPQQLAVTGNDTWAQYGELIMAPGRLMAPTEVIDPNDNPPTGTSSTGGSNVAAITLLADQQARSQIILDDGRTSTYPIPPPLIGPQGTVRCGSTVTGLTGVVHYAFSQYRVHPVGTVPMQHATRPAVPTVGGGLRIASLNVRNYFTTLGSNGANTAAELQRQRAKLVAALLAMQADAYVLCELENGDAASNDLLAALNSAMGGGYAVIDHDAPGSFTRTVFLYRTATLAPVTELMLINSGTFERAHLTQGFSANASGKRFLLSGVHLRSKLCDGATGSNLDQSDGQGCFNARRRTQVGDLITHWQGLRAATWIPGQLIVGDFNAYDQEDPIDRLRAAGMIDLIAGVPQPWTFRFENRSGSLDHAFATAQMADAITGALPWNINSDEPPNLDYRDGNQAYYQANGFRCSDHDPILIGIDPELIPVGVAELAAEPVVRFTYDPDSRTASWEGEGDMRVELMDALGRMLTAPVEGTSGRVIIRMEGLPAGTYLWRCRPMGARGASSGRFMAW